MTAVTAICKETVDVLVEYDEEIRSPSTAMKLPAVIRLRKPLPKKKNSPKFSRLGIYTRDNWTCQYCGKVCKWNELTYDHVLPRKQLGATCWTNIVSACARCNAKKGSQTPEESGMYPRKEPCEPKSLPLTPRIELREPVPKEWEPFLKKN